MTEQHSNPKSDDPLIALYDHKLSQIETNSIKTFIPKTKIKRLSGLFGTRLTQMFAEMSNSAHSPSWSAYTISNSSLIEYIQLTAQGLLYLGTFNRFHEGVLRGLVARYDFVKTIDHVMPILLYQNMDAFNRFGNDGFSHAAHYSNIIKGVNDAETQNVLYAFEAALTLMKVPQDV